MTRCCQLVQRRPKRAGGAKVETQESERRSFDAPSNSTVGTLVNTSTQCSDSLYAKLVQSALAQMWLEQDQRLRPAGARACVSSPPRADASSAAQHKACSVHASPASGLSQRRYRASFVPAGAAVCMRGQQLQHSAAGCSLHCHAVLLLSRILDGISSPMRTSVHFRLMRCLRSPLVAVVVQL